MLNLNSAWLLLTEYNHEEHIQIKCTSRHREILKRKVKFHVTKQGYIPNVIIGGILGMKKSSLANV